MCPTSQKHLICVKKLQTKVSSAQQPLILIIAQDQQANLLFFLAASC